MKKIYFILMLFITSNLYADFYILKTSDDKIKSKLITSKDISLWDNTLLEGERYIKVTEDIYNDTKLDDLRTEEQKEKERKYIIMKAQKELNAIIELEKIDDADYSQEKIKLNNIININKKKEV